MLTAYTSNLLAVNWSTAVPSRMLDAGWGQAVAAMEDEEGAETQATDNTDFTDRIVCGTPSGDGIMATVL